MWIRAWFLPSGTGSRTFLLRSYIKDDYDFSDLKMASPFYTEAYAFLPGNRRSTRIYGYTYSYITCTRTRKQYILNTKGAFGRLNSFLWPELIDSEDMPDDKN